MNNKKVEGIILAAGFSKRAGTFKMTMKLKGNSLLDRCIESMNDACCRIIVVGGYKVEGIRPIVEKYKNAELIINENYTDGMFSSIKKGLEYINGSRFFLTPGDYPAIQCQVYKDMLEISGDVVIPTYKGKRGHPILIKSSLISKILLDNEYTNLREFVNEHGFTTIEVLDKGILMDVDTPYDYHKIYRHLSN